MAKENLSIRIDSELKNETQIILEKLGLNITTAVTMLAKQIVMQKKIPFEIALHHNADTIQAMEDVNNEVGLSEAFETLEELMEDLDA